ncbi:MAG: hypothetical protein V3S16_12630 [Candidatus Desulfatibia sp.]|uniref:hypothetical protein n=1 Tax=Candidatus Desulfatibia sp. TaxID=3101189 RepID=UPI002F2EF6EC
MTSASAFAYSYAEATDPTADIFKEAVVAAKGGNWGKVSGLAKKGVALQKGHLFEADFLAKPLSEAIDKKDVAKTAELFANLAYLSIREKLHQNKKENFKNYKNAKARLQLARKSYMDVLDGNVRKQKAASSLAIMSQFNVALENIGNPGLFGVGKKAPDPSGYNQAVKQIEALIVDSFPSFAK